MTVDTTVLAAAIGVVNTVVMIGGGFYMMGGLNARLKRVENDVRDTKGLVVSAAVDASRLARAESDIHDMKRGIGFINDRGAPGVAREY